jgi:hypothetical protein
VVAKHRRSEEEPSLASVGAPANAGGYGSEPTLHPSGLPMRNGNRSSNGYRRPADGATWAAALAGYSGEQNQDWQDWGPPPTLHPDHPSAPVPRIQFAAEHPSRPMSSPRTPVARPGHHRQVRPGWRDTTDYRRESGPFRPGPGSAGGRPQNGHSAGRDPLWSAGQVLSVADGQAAHIEQEARDYAAAMRVAAEHQAAEITQQANSRANAITQQAAVHADAITQQASTRADVITQQAADQAAAMARQAADQAADMAQQAADQAVAIREAAEREAAEMRARLDAMSGELSRLATYFAGSVAAPAGLATAPPLPALPDAEPVLPGTGAALPGTIPAMPDTRPARPDARPARPDARPARPDARPARPDTDNRPARPATPARTGTRPTRPDRPVTRPARPETSPRTRPAERTAPKTAPVDKKPGRQLRAMRIATFGTAALLSIAAIGAVTEIGLHGFNFFVFREGGQGETPGNFHDTNFLARQAAQAQHHDAAAPKGRHHKVAQGH